MRRATQRNRTRTIDNSDWQGWADPSISVNMCDEALAARRVVMQLRRALRIVLKLGILQGLSCSEISNRLQIPVSTVKIMMRRGLIQARELMGV
jgi:RNA polymerase sigma-70 factor, ECF subfamily